MSTLSVREIHQSDIPLIADYWLLSDPGFMKGMGVQQDKLLSREQWYQMLEEQLVLPYDQKQSYCIIWEIDGRPVGHSNANRIRYGQDAYMHLHLWNNIYRQKGSGSALVRMTLPYFFERLRLKTLYCEPYALNPAPNNTLPRLGFTFVRTHRTIPGPICFEQDVNLWALTEAAFRSLV